MISTCYLYACTFSTSGTSSTIQYVYNQAVYYDFLERPPVERVNRLYSVDEVKRLACVRTPLAVSILTRRT